jgi:hypothetical protein
MELKTSLLTSSNFWVWVLCYADDHSASLFWNKEPIWGLHLDFNYCQTIAGLLIWGTLSDEKTGLSFTIAAGPCQCRHFAVWVPYFTVSVLRFPFSSPPTTRRAAVEVFDTTSTWDCSCLTSGYAAMIADTALTDVTLHIPHLISLYSATSNSLLWLSAFNSERVNHSN